MYTATDARRDVAIWKSNHTEKICKLRDAILVQVQQAALQGKTSLVYVSVSVPPSDPVASAVIAILRDNGYEVDVVNATCIKVKWNEN